VKTKMPVTFKVSGIPLSLMMPTNGGARRASCCDSRVIDGPSEISVH
jgi:hypothetical protein